MLNSVQRIVLSAAFTGVIIGAGATALYYESTKKDEKITDLEYKNSVLAKEKDILIGKIQKLEKAASEAEKPTDAN